MPPTPPSIDHLILFTPTPAIPTAFTPFTPTPGGTHADNLTANTLILLADGSYIELIHFLPSAAPSAITTHWWGPTRSPAPAWKDWCLTTTSPASETHAHLTSSHSAPVPGARQRADGVTVSWAVTFPRGERGGQAHRGRVPFFCHDVTPRELRVPLSEHATTHACGALGVREICVVVRERGVWEETRRVYEGVFGPGVEEGGAVVFEAGRVVGVEGLGGVRVLLRLAGDEEREKVGERGFWVGDVVFAARAEGKEGKDVGVRERLDGEGEGVGGLWIEYV